MKIAVLIMLAALFGCQPKEYRDDVAKMRATLDANLKDYPSARFRNVTIVKAVVPPPAYMACGEVNARNGAGGYTGWKWFMVLGEKFDTDTVAPKICPEMARDPEMARLRVPGDRSKDLAYRR